MEMLESVGPCPSTRASRLRYAPANCVLIPVYFASLLPVCSARLSRFREIGNFIAILYGRAYQAPRKQKLSDGLIF